MTTMKYNGVIQRKLALLDDQVVKIKEYVDPVPESEFLDSWPIQAMAERALQVAVEIMIDIAERMIALKDAGPAASAREAIENLAALNVIESAEPYREMVGFRNVIVHEYERVDPASVYRLVAEHLEDFRRFRDEIDRACADSD
jgi:uncharacterized protein YutE (UPF0331/DUF86 family)